MYIRAWLALPQAQCMPGNVHKRSCRSSVLCPEDIVINCRSVIHCQNLLRSWGPRAKIFFSRYPIKEKICDHEIWRANKPFPRPFNPATHKMSCQKNSGPGVRCWSTLARKWRISFSLCKFAEMQRRPLLRAYNIHNNNVHSSNSQKKNGPTLPLLRSQPRPSIFLILSLSFVILKFVLSQ